MHTKKPYEFRRLQMIDEALFSGYRKVKVLIPYTKGNLVHYLQENADILTIDYQDHGTLIEVNLSDHLQAIYKEFIIQ